MRRFSSILLAMLIVIGAGSPASADDSLLLSIPGVREQTGSMPSQVVLAFSMALDDGTVEVFDSSGKSVASSGTTVELNNASVHLAYPLPRGTYRVEYRVVRRGDQRVYGGSYQFSYGPGKFTDLPKKTFGGPANVPASVAEEGDEDTPEPTVTVSPTPTVTSSPVTVTDPTAPAAGESDGVSPWIWAGASSAVLLALGLLLALLRRRRAQGGDTP